MRTAQFQKDGFNYFLNNKDMLTKIARLLVRFSISAFGHCYGDGGGTGHCY